MQLDFLEQKSGRGQNTSLVFLQCPKVRALEKGMAIPTSILAWEFHGQKSLEGYSPWGSKETEVTNTFTKVRDSLNPG